MEKIYYDVIYLTACGVNSVRPSEAFLMELKRRGEEDRAVDIQAAEGSCSEGLLSGGGDAADVRQRYFI